MNDKFKPSITHFKILVTIEELNALKYYPLPRGVLNILSGAIDDETKKFVGISTFGSLVSYPSKKISRYILMLTRYGYLKKIYDEKTDNLYLKITEYGSAQTAKFLAKHHCPFKKKEKKQKTYIIKIEKI